MHRNTIKICREFITPYGVKRNNKLVLKSLNLNDMHILIQTREYIELEIQI